MEEVSESKDSSSQQFDKEHTQTKLKHLQTMNASLKSQPTFKKMKSTLLRKSSRFVSRLDVGNPMDELILRMDEEKKKQIERRKLMERRNREDPLPGLNPESQHHLVINEKKRSIEKCLDHMVTVVFLTVITIYALFFDDIKIVSIDKEYDDIFSGITLFCIIAYTIEITLSSYAKKDYYKSFFFLLDIFSTISMIPDCQWLYEGIVD